MYTDYLHDRIFSLKMTLKRTVYPTDTCVRYWKPFIVQKSAKVRESAIAPRADVSQEYIFIFFVSFLAV